MLFKEWLLKRRKRKAIKVIRQYVIDFGLSFDYLSDCEVEKCLHEIGIMLWKSGISLEKGIEAMKQFNKSFKIWKT